MLILIIPFTVIQQQVQEASCKTIKEMGYIQAACSFDEEVTNTLQVKK